MLPPGNASPLTLGPGYRAIAWTLDPNRTVVLIAVLFILHALATVLTVEGGGTGGLFIPLVVQGWLLGRFIQGIAGTHTRLFPVIGAAALAHASGDLHKRPTALQGRLEARACVGRCRCRAD